jgi:hypothetical protein
MFDLRSHQFPSKRLTAFTLPTFGTFSISVLKLHITIIPYLKQCGNNTFFFVHVDHLRTADMSAKSGRGEVLFIVIAGAAALSQVRGSHSALGTKILREMIR